MGKMMRPYQLRSIKYRAAIGDLALLCMLIIPFAFKKATLDV